MKVYGHIGGPLDRTYRIWQDDGDDGPDTVIGHYIWDGAGTYQWMEA